MGDQRRVKVSSEKRQLCITLINEAVKAGARKYKACEVIEISLRTIERWEINLIDQRKGPNKVHNKFTQQEKEKILKTVNEKKFSDLSCSKIVPALADQGEYIGSESTICRILKEENLLNHRSKSHPKRFIKPKALVATAPNQVWSWDITYIATMIKGSFFYLYLPIDIFSRFIIHWEVHEIQSDFLAAQMIKTACQKENIHQDQLKLHSDNGSSMKGATMMATLALLGVAPSFSRPRVSDDNPFSESIFKTLKYCPEYPENGFANIEVARIWVNTFVDWYNHKHLHSGIKYVTPYSRHYGYDKIILEKREEVYKKASLLNPKRWSRKTRNWGYINKVTLNNSSNSKNNRQ